MRQPDLFVRHGAAIASVMLCLAPIASAQWVDDPAVNTPLVSGQPGATLPKWVTADDGTSWVTWFDQRSGGYGLYAQKVSPGGEIQFGAGGVVVSEAPQSTSLVDYDAVLDGEGGIVVVFTDTRAGGDLDVYAQRIDASGAALWGANGVAVSDNSDFEASPMAVRDESGDFLVTWPRADSTPGLFFQRLTPAGSPVLAPGGVRIAGGGTESPAFQQMAPAPGGGFFMSFVRDTRTFLSPRHVHAQKFDANGAAQWNGGSPVIVSDAAVVPIAHLPRLATDGAGGIAVAWHDVRTGDFNAWVQRIDASGAALYAEDGVNASTRAGEQQLDPAPAFTDDGLVVAYRTTNSNQSQMGIGVQRFTGAGVRALGDDGVTVEPMTADAISFVNAVEVQGDVVASWIASPLGGAIDTIVATRLDEAGAEVWAGGSIAVSTRATDKLRLRLTTDDSDNVRALWEESGSGVAAQLIQPDGSLGGVGEACEGDTNGDGRIDFADLNTVLNGFGTKGASLPGDLTGDGRVDFADLNLVLNRFGSECDG